jgi:hypothetical protein
MRIERTSSADGPVPTAVSSAKFPKPWTDEVVRAADVVITMGCGDACPIFPSKRYLNLPVRMS